MNKRPRLIEVDPCDEFNHLSNILREPYLNEETLIELKNKFETKYVELKRNEANFKLLEYFLLKNRLTHSSDPKNQLGHLELYDTLNQILYQEIHNVILCSFNSNEI